MSEPHIAFSRGGRTTDRGVLFTSNSQPLTLLGTAIDVETQWTHARVKIRQEYRSDHPISVSAFAAFDITDPSWQLLSFRCEVGQQAAFTKVVQKPAGQATYASQRTEKRDQIFTANIPFSIHAGQSVLCTTIYACPLQSVGPEKVVFNLPKNMVPGAKEIQGSDWKKSFTVPHETRLPNGRTIFNAEGQLYSTADGNPAVQQASSYPGATAQKKADPKKYLVQLEDRNPSLTLPSDIAYEIPLIQEEDPVTVQVVRDNGEHVAAEDKYALAVALDPQFPAGSKPNVELVVMLDDSFSMQPHAAAVKDALKAMAAGLPPCCFLNCVKFGGSSQPSWLFGDDGSVLCDADSINDFNDFINKWNPQDNATKILQGVREVYSQPSIEGYARVVVLVTDGSEARHSGSIIEIVDANKHTTRMVSLALGENADQKLLSTLAEVSGGLYANVANPEMDLCAELCDCVGKTLVPTVCHVDASFIYDGVDEVPPVRKCFATVPLVPQGSRVFLYGLGGEDLRGCTCAVTGSSGPTHLDYKVHTGEIGNADKVSSNPGDASTASLAHQAAALNRIRSLVDYNINSTLKSDEAAEVERLGISFSVPTPLTTFQGHDAAGPCDPKCKMTTYRYAYLKQLFQIEAPAATLTASGNAVDPDSRAGKAVAAQLASNNKSAAAPTTAAKAVAKNVLDEIVSSICAPVSAPAVLQAQRVNGRFSVEHPAVINLLGMSVADIMSKKPVDVSDNTWVTALVHKKMGATFSYKTTRLASGKALGYLAGQSDYTVAEEALGSVEL